MTQKKSLLKITAQLGIIAIFGAIAAFASIYLYLSPKLPPVESLRQTKLQTPLRIFSSDNRLIGEFGEKKRQPLSYSEVPPDFINALLAAEDDGFYGHSGVDITGLLRAASQLVSSGEIQTGGSTITMQVARNFFLTRKQTFTRKFNEILLALQIESELTKQEILELYINKIYLGNRAYGIEAAAQVYYGKSIIELDLAQQAMIAGLPKAPSAFNPIINPDRAVIRRNWILGRMLSLGMIDVEQHNLSVKTPVTATYHGTSLDVPAPYISEMARQEALKLLGEAAYTDGYKVFTTVNSDLQKSAQAAVIDGLMSYDERHGYRGPEKQLAIPDNWAFERPPQTEESNPDLEPTPANRVLQDFPEEWLDELKSTPRLGGLIPAVVLDISDTDAIALLSSGDLVTLAWEESFPHARPYIDENKRGPKPKSIGEIIATGDVIRLKKAGEIWTLSQIPMAQAALVAIDPNNGEIKSLVGGFDFKQSNFNRATQAERQPGSNFKPFIYTAALENGLTPATMINDAPIVFDDSSLEGTWRPENSSGKFYGPTRLRQALFKSRNLVSIRVLRNTGIAETVNSLSRFGIDPSKLPKDLSLSLGSYALTPLEIASAYTPFANGGYKVEPFLIDIIEDGEGNVVYQADPVVVCKECERELLASETTEADTLDDISALEAALTAELENELNEETDPEPQTKIAPRVIDEKVVYLMDDMLRDVIKMGTGRRAKVLSRSDIAGKTGTTNGPKDAWFSGYNPDMVTTTWLGFDQNFYLGRGEYGGTSALPIWIDFMRVALADKPEKVRELPPGLISVRIDPDTGKRAQPDSPNAIFETFRLENVPEMAEEEVTTDLDNDSPLPEDLF